MNILFITKLKILFLIPRHFSPLPIMLTIRMVNTFWARSSISFEQVSLWCLFLDPHLTIHHSSVVTQIRWVYKLGLLTLGLMGIIFIFWQVQRTYENPLGYYDSELTKNTRDWKEVLDIRPRSDYNTGVKVGTGIHKNQWPSTPPNVRCVIPTEVVTIHVWFQKMNQYEVWSWPSYLN
jgi:hypothetical protein